MPESTPSDREIVTSLLAMSGISPTAEEVDALVTTYPQMRAAVAALYTLPGVRYEEPAVTFDPRI